ncbi:MAG: ParB/RepB/Spo0J family partition protein [Bacilli bacterium]
MEQKKKALGKGLEELFSSEVLDFDTFESNIMETASQEEIKEIPVSEIRPNPYQPRKTFNEEALKELSESIKNYGVFQPIIVKKSIKGYDLIAGERRLRASKLAGLDKIPAIVKDFTDEEMREISLLENIQRENLTAIELAWAYKGIIDNLDIRQEDLALKIGKSRSHITNTLGLLNLPEEVQKMILNGEISMGHARVLSKMEDKEEVTELADKIVKENMSVHSLEEISKSEDIRKRVPITRRDKPALSKYSQIESEMQEILGTKVKIDNKKINIYFENINDLNRILEIMNMEIK